MKIGLIAHVGKKGAAQAVKVVLEEFQKYYNIFLFLEKETALLIGENSSLSEAALAKQCDLLLVMGGDGSILRSLQQLEGNLKPIFGLNIGSLGFLTCLPANEYKRAIQCIVNKNYLLSERSLLEVYISSASQPKEKIGIALNDLVISRGKRSQLVQLSVSIDGTFFTEYHADGLIISTPTGSTAYSLAAGGPIVLPESKTLIITPICPHVFSNRSMVISDESEITIRASKEQEVFISLDGRQARLLQAEEKLHIITASQTLPLAMLPETNFAEILRQKLHWIGSNINTYS